MTQTAAVGPLAAYPAGTARVTALDAALDSIRHAHDFPAVSGRIHRLMDLMGDRDVSVQQMANLLLQDYSLTVTLLRTANSFQFNRSGRPIVSVSHAIVMMGFTTIRTLVSGIIVFEHYRRRSPGLRELLMLSLLTANHARELATRTGALKGEEAYLFGMLRNLGEVLVACHLPAQYGDVLKDMAAGACTAEASCRRILQFSYEELAAGVLRDWHLASVEPFLLDPPTRPDAGYDIVSFAHALTAAVYRQRPEQASPAVNLLLRKYASLRLDRDEVGEVLEAALASTSETFAHAQVALNQLQLQHQIRAAIDADDADASDPPRRD